MLKRIDSKISASLTLQAFLMLAFGVYLLSGAYYGFTYAKWPYFMPPQLDVFGLLFGFLGEQVGGYVGGGLLGLLGLFFALIGIVPLVKSNAD
jgi:hypothetical protein